MSFLFSKVFIVILVVAFKVSSIAGIFAEDSKDEDIQRDARDRTGMWFGPRLGKRTLHGVSEKDKQAVYRMLEAADALKYYYDQFQYYGAQADDPEVKETVPVSKKIIFTPKLGRNVDDDKQDFEVDFTPRLGRRRTDEAVTPSDRESFRNGPEQIETRSQYFSPRLGRGHNMNFSPRLGRNLLYDLYSDGKVRVTRSTNKTKST